MKSRFGIMLFVVSLLAGLGVLGRLVPHPPNFAPVTAIAIFAGFYFSDWRVAAAVPLICLAVSDFVVGGYETPLMVAVYLSTLVPLLFGPLLRRNHAPIQLGFCTLASSVSFFFMTNLAVWQFGGWYSYDWNGLVLCFLAALPFFRYTLLSNLLFAGAIFGAYALICRVRILAAWTPLAARPPVPALQFVSAD